MPNVKVVPKPIDAPLTGINRVAQRFPSMWFDQGRCGKVLEALGAYRWAEDRKGQLFKSKPVADWSAHVCDAGRTYFEAELAGLVRNVMGDPGHPAALHDYFGRRDGAGGRGSRVKPPVVGRRSAVGHFPR